MPEPDPGELGDGSSAIEIYRNPIWNLIHLIPFLFILSALYMDKNRGKGVWRLLPVMAGTGLLILLSQYGLYLFGWYQHVPLLDGAMLALLAVSSWMARSGEAAENAYEGIQPAAFLAFPAVLLFGLITTGLSYGLFLGIGLAFALYSGLQLQIDNGGSRAGFLTRLLPGVLLVAAIFLGLNGRREGWTIHAAIPASGAAILMIIFMILLYGAFTRLATATPVFCQRLAGSDRLKEKMS